LVGEPAAQIDAGFIIQIDIQDDAESVAEIAMPQQRFPRGKQSRIEAVLSQ
jgi:hypothetical protein